MISIDPIDRDNVIIATRRWWSSRESFRANSPRRGRGRGAQGVERRASGTLKFAILLDAINDAQPVAERAWAGQLVWVAYPAARKAGMTGQVQKYSRVRIFISPPRYRRRRLRRPPKPFGLFQEAAGSPSADEYRRGDSEVFRHVWVVRIAASFRRRAGRSDLRAFQKIIDRRLHNENRTAYRRPPVRHPGRLVTLRHRADR